MQDTSSSDQGVHVKNSNGQSQQSSSLCSNSTLSDSGSWDTDFEDDRYSESSGLYGDVDFPLAERHSSDAEGKTKSCSQGRVAALAKTVAASLAVSGSPGGVKASKPFSKQTDFLSMQANGGENGRNISSSSNTTSRPIDRPPSKPLSKPPVPLRPTSASNNTHHSCRMAVEEKKSSGCKGTSCGCHLGHSSNCSSLPKPPGAISEQVQQVLGVLGHLWPSDSISLSSQTQSDDDYEPIQSDSSPQMSRLSPNSSYLCQEPATKTHLHSSLNCGNNCLVPNPIPEAHSVPEHCDSNSMASQSTHFLHSPAAASALAAAAASAVANRLSQCSKRSSSSESNTYSQSNGSSLSEHSLHSLPSGQHDGVYEPIEEKNKVSMPAQKSYLHSAEKSEKFDVKRTSPQLVAKTVLQEQRPPVPNRPLPPTPKPSGDSIRVGSLLTGLENQPWFHNVDRKQAEQLIKKGSDGYFLIRPSSQSQNLLTLTLLFNQRVYNISVRQRKDGRIALGFEKPDEQSFDSIEEMVTNYQSENLLLFSRNERTGRTVLTKSPPKQR